MSFTIRILAFGIAKDILKTPSLDLDTESIMRVQDLRRVLEERFPALHQLPSYRIAINHDFADDTDTIIDSDEVAIIPPVSGG